MKKLLIALSLVFSLQVTYAQKAVYTEMPDKLFTQGKEMFLDNNYLGCINSLNDFKKLSKDPRLVQEAEFMIVSSLYYRGTDNSDQLLKDYLEKYPSTLHRNQLNFFIGSTHFAKKEWKVALHWLSQADMFYLSQSDKEDFLYRSAYANLQEGGKDYARGQFEVLTRTSQKYSDPASYYLAYIDFQEGKYDQAINVFRLLQNKPEYKENASFFLIQSIYLKGDYSQTITEGERYLASYGNSANVSETSRLLGSSYYKIGNVENSIRNYERYVQIEKTPFREDMFQLGSLYYQTAEYTKAVNVLKKSASSEDLLGQAGNMMLGQSYLKLNDTNSALMAFDAAARSKFDSTISEEALYNYVMLTNRGGSGAFGESITAFQRFFTEYPKSKYSDAASGALASTLLSTKNYTLAMNAIESIKNPGRPILEAKQIILYQQGVQSFIGGEYDAAMSKFDASIAMGNYSMDVKKESFFWRAETLYRKGEYKDAARDYSTYVSEVSLSEQNYLPALYNLGYAYYQTKDYNKALSSLSRYTSMETDRKNPTYADALNRVGDCYLFRRDFSTAENYYKQATAADPNNADYAEFQRAFVLGLQHKYADKVTALNGMMSKYPNSGYYSNALYEKSRAYVMLNKDKEAITQLETLLKDYPKSGLAQKAGVQLGQLYFNNDNSTKSIAAYKKVIAEYPNTEESQIAVKSLEGVYKDINDIGSYANYVNSLGSGMVVTASRQDTLTFQAAENVYMKGRKADSKNSFNKYLQAYPNGRFTSDAHFYLGNMAFEAKDKMTALTHFKEVISAKNIKFIDDALIFASGIEYDNNDYESAYATYEHLNQVTSSSGNRDVAQLGMLRSAYLLKKDSEVISAASKLLENKNASADVAIESRFYRGKSLKNTGKLGEALVDLKEVGKNTRTAFGAESQCLMASILYQQKQYDAGEKQVLAFMKEGTPHDYWMARTIVVLADIYKAKGDNFQAIQYLESLQANYKGGEADLTEMIAKRLADLAN